MLRFSSNHSFIQGMYQKRPHFFVTPCPLNITCNVSHRKAVYILKKKYKTVPMYLYNLCFILMDAASD